MSCAAHSLANSRHLLVPEDVDLIQEAVRMLPTDRWINVVDLGAGSGTTALSVFCERPLLIGITTVDHDPVALASTEQCMLNAGFAGIWLPVEMKSNDPAAVRVGVLGGPIDFLMVDADHSYEAVKADINAWLPWVRPGAPVWFHDYEEREPGVIRAVDEAVAKGLLVPVKTTGWGWLGVKVG